MVFETPALIWILTSSNRMFKLVEITHTNTQKFRVDKLELCLWKYVVGRANH